MFKQTTPNPKKHCGCIQCEYVTRQIMGVPFLVCRKCGAGLPVRVKEQTMTHQEMHDIQQKRKYPRTVKEIVSEIWERKHGNKR